MSGKDNQRRTEKSYIRHPLSCQSETDSGSSEEALRYVCHNDPHEKDDSVEPVVAQDESDYEETDTKEDGDCGDDVDEVLNLLGDGGLATLKSRDEPSNPAHHRVVSDVDHHPDTGSLHGVCRKEGEVSCLEGVLRCKYSDQLDIAAIYKASHKELSNLHCV